MRRLKNLQNKNLLFKSCRKEVQQAAKLAENLKPVKPKYILDAGFHHGWFSHILSLVYPDIEVCACDPFDYRELWMISPSIPVKFFPVGVSNDIGSMDIILMNDPQLHSVLPFNKDYETAFGPIYKLTKETKSVQVTTIDNLLTEMAWQKCDLLKLDIQGTELDALMGAEKSFNKIGAIYLEISFEQIYNGQAVFGQIDDYLKLHGFQLSKISNPQGGQYLLQADALYLNRQFYPLC